MLTFAFTLAFASSAFEMMIAAKIPVWRRLASQSVLINLFGSIAIAWSIGTAFGAAGLIAMTAGLFSTLLSIPGYRFLHWCYDSPQAQSHGGNMLKHYSEQWQSTKARWGQTLRDLATLIHKIIRIITFPIWFTRLCVLKYQTLRARFARTS